MRKLLLPFFFVLIISVLPSATKAFGVFTHEAIIDAAWERSLLPYLKKNYPASTPEELKTAHAYAYGGALSPDMGYYPGGSKLFTDLVHYVRSGDMVIALLKEASTLNELAFALGYLSHHFADEYGHPLATNISVPILYPKIKKRFGNRVTYADDELSHKRMEFGFDVLQIATGNYASQSYREYIGFKVDTAVLSRAFTAVYGLDINKVHKNHFGRSVETFRWVVANVLPLVTRQAWATKKKAIMEADSTATSQRFNYKMRRKVYNKNFGTGYEKPGLFPTIISYFIRILPKIGPLAPLKFKVPGEKEELYFVQSFDSIQHHFTGFLQQMKTGVPALQDINYDTGKPTEICEYTLADATYTELLLVWEKKGLQTMPLLLRTDILKFYDGKTTAAVSTPCDKFWLALKDLRSN